MLLQKILFEPADERARARAKARAHGSQVCKFWNRRTWRALGSAARRFNSLDLTNRYKCATSDLRQFEIAVATHSVNRLRADAQDFTRLLDADVNSVWVFHADVIAQVSVYGPAHFSLDSLAYCSPARQDISYWYQTV